MLKKVLCPFLLIMALCFGVLAQDSEDAAPKTPTLEMVIPGAEPPTKNIMFVVDTSGSMVGQKVMDAINSTIEVASAPVDDLQIAIITFGTGVRRWPGTRDVNPDNGEIISRDGWSLMPSQPNLDAAYAWMLANTDGENSNANLAMQQAFIACEDIDPVSILLVTDGILTVYDYLVGTIEEKQNRRVALGLRPVTLGFFGIDVPPRYEPRVRDLVGTYDGSAWTPTRFRLGYIALRYPSGYLEESYMLPVPLPPTPR